MTTRVTHLPRLRDGWSRPRAELDESSRAAGLEAVVDRTFNLSALARRRAPALPMCTR